MRNEKEVIYYIDNEPNWKYEEIPLHLRVLPKIVERAVQEDWRLLGVIDRDKITQLACETAIGKSWESLQYVPRDLPNYKQLCVFAIRHNANAIQYVSAPYPDFYDDLCSLSVGIDVKSLIFVHHASGPSNDIYKKYIKINGLNLEHIPLEKRDEELCEIAISQNPMSLQFSPEANVSEDIRTKAVIANPNCIQFISYTSNRHTLFELAIESNPETLKYLHLNQRENPDLLAAFFKSKNWSLELLPKEFRSEVICKAAFFEDWRIYEEYLRRRKGSYV